ncbi:MAG: class I SAM-dependent DNA methyltransferase [Pseudomonadota bacterium]
MTDAIDTFITRWQAAGGSERANYQLFVSELARLLGQSEPHPAGDLDRDNGYVFERRVTFRHGDGSSSNGFIDCYRRGAFVLEAKKIKAGAETKGFDDALLRARAQAENYARALPADEGRPPFLLVVDVGRVIEVYAEFSRTGATYTPFPDPRSHRIRLDDLRDAALRARLATIWHDPLSLDPTKRTARATREIAVRLARVAQSLEGRHPPEAVAGFLSRCLFSMFAEDVGLLPKTDGVGAFTGLLKSLRDSTAQFVPLVGELWKAMDSGEFSVAIRAQLPRFNGKLFKQPEVLPLDRDQIDLLLEAATADWSEVEPAIFGTLLERALDPAERHSLGAHYTPRAYVERLVLPAVIQPLREDWANSQAAALLLANEGKPADALKLLHDYHHRLCQIRVLDPACGSGNFLYVTMEHMKRLEGEVLNQIEALAGGQDRLETEGLSIDPHQFLGIELNPRAAAIAEMVLWIGHLQWHYRTRGRVLPPSPILRDFKNIECRDAVLAHDGMTYATDEHGVPITRWDGKTTKSHPVTGEQVPDETARVPLEVYANPRPAEWPAADYVVGNPPFIGNKRMRLALGDGYTEALRAAWQDTPDTADFVMYWWLHAAQLVAQGKLSRFGFITTNSITQIFNRRIVQEALDTGLHIDFAIPDHPWVDSADGADVRIAMTVTSAGQAEGRWQAVVAEREGGSEGLEVELAERIGIIHADLTAGANVAGAQPLRANAGLCYQGMNLVGKGFRITPEEVPRLGYSLDNLPPEIKPHRNARDMMQGGEDIFVIDLFGYTAEEARSRHPTLYQWLFDRVKPERDHNKDAQRRRDWWLFGRSNRDLRKSWVGLERIVLTPETSKHRVFSFQALPFCPDHKLYAICCEDAWVLGVLSSSAHIPWALAAGGRLGVGNDPTWTNTTCFLTFPFPAATPDQQARIRALAEELDAHRKRRQAAHPDLTLTGMYNVLAKLRTGEALSAKDKLIHEQGLVSVLKQLHDELDAAVLDAYGWSDLLPSSPEGGAGGEGAFADTLLERLVALNAERRREEAAGHVRWLRPEFQNPSASTAEAGAAAPTETAESAAKPAFAITKQPWPAALPEQVAAVARVLADATIPLSEADLAARFTGKGPWKKRLPQLLDTLVALGRARAVDGGWLV